MDVVKDLCIQLGITSDLDHEEYVLFADLGKRKYELYGNDSITAVILNSRISYILLPMGAETSCAFFKGFPQFLHHISVM